LIKNTFSSAVLLLIIDSMRNYLLTGKKLYYKKLKIIYGI